MSLLRQIQEAATDSSGSLPSLLRKCKVLAARLDSPEFKQWLTYELEGYPSKDTLPEYRVLNVYSKGYFSGPGGSSLDNADIPMRCIPKDMREALSHSYLMQPVAAIEALIQDDHSGTRQEPWNPNVVSHVGANIYRGMNCLQAWKVVPAGALVAALDTVRTRVLNFALEIEAQNPQAGEAELNSTPVPKEVVHQIFNTYVTGNIQNLAPGSTDVRQTAKYVETNNSELFVKLLDAITNAGLRPEAIAPIAAIVKDMRDTEGTSDFTRHYQSFMSTLADHMQVLGPVVAPFLPMLSGLLT